MTQKLDFSPCLLSIRWQLFPFYDINGPQNVRKLYQNSRLRSSVWLPMAHVPISKGRDGYSYSDAQNYVPAHERLLRTTCTVHLQTAVRTLWRLKGTNLTWNDTPGGKPYLANIQTWYFKLKAMNGPTWMCWLFISSLRPYYRYAPHNDVSVDDGPHIRRWSPKIMIL